MKENQQMLEGLVKKRTSDLEKDIAERKLAEQALRESELKYKNLIKQAPSGIYEINFRSKKFVSVNDAMCLLTGYSRKELLSMSAFEILADESKKAFKLRINRWSSGEKPDENIEYKVTAKDGHLIYALLNVKFKADEKGNPTGAMVVAHDITERKLSEEALLKNEKLLKSVLDNVNSGVALIDETGMFTVFNPLFLKLFGLSEDSTIKNVNDEDWAEWKVFNEDGTLLHADDHPVRKAAMTGKRIDQQLVGVKLPSGGEIIWMLISAEPILKVDGKYINFAVDGAKRMHDLLNGLLAYSRMNSKAQEFRRVDLNDVLSSVTKNLSLLIKERRTVIHAPKLPVVFTDEFQMIQLFQNLISNSIKFSTGSPEIFISVKNQINQFVFSFKDEGIGIEPKYFERIFLIFQRIFPREKYEGTGIGLAVCKRIVERHGGKIWVESEPEKGSTFIFTIPNVAKS